MPDIFSLTLKQILSKLSRINLLTKSLTCLKIIRSEFPEIRGSVAADSTIAISNVQQSRPHTSGQKRLVTQDLSGLMKENSLLKQRIFALEDELRGKSVSDEPNIQTDQSIQIEELKRELKRKTAIIEGKDLPDPQLIFNSLVASLNGYQVEVQELRKQLDLSVNSNMNFE